jgi:hypothetical protein
MNLTIMFSVANLATSGETPFLAHSTKADIRREIVTGLQAWFKQTGTALEAAVAEDADEVAIRMGKDEDDPDDSDNDSDYNSIDAERDAQEEDDDEGKPHPQTEVPLRLVSLLSRLDRYELG